MADSMIQVYSSNERHVRLQRASKVERQPHLYGIRSGTYEDGTMPGNMKEPPHRWPERAYANRLYPFHARRYVEAMRLCVAGTDAAPEKQRPLIILALGGEARRVAEDISLIYRQIGAIDPISGEWVSGPELIDELSSLNSRRTQKYRCCAWELNFSYFVHDLVNSWKYCIYDLIG